MSTGTRIQSLCLWSGYAFFVLYLTGIVLIARFIPPPAPGLEAEAIAAFFDQRRGQILVGMVVCAFASALYVPWGVAIYGVMLRAERTRFAPLSVVQVLSAGVGAAFFALSPLVWLAMAFRPAHAPDSLLILNDFAWISWIVSWPFFFVQAMAVGLCALAYPSAALPRWLAYFSIWFAASLFPAILVVFFKQGAFAWNGVLGFFLPLSMFALWYQVVTFCVWRANKAHSSREQTASPEALSSAVEA